MPIVHTAAAAEYLAVSRYKYAFAMCVSVAASARGGQTLTPASRVAFQETSTAAEEVLARMAGTLTRESEVRVPGDE